MLVCHGLGPLGVLNLNLISLNLRILKFNLELLVGVLNKNLVSLNFRILKFNLKLLVGFLNPNSPVIVSPARYMSPLRRNVQNLPPSGARELAPALDRVTTVADLKHLKVSGMWLLYSDRRGVMSVLRGDPLNLFAVCRARHSFIDLQ